MPHLRLTDAKVRALSQPGVYRDDKVRGLFVDVHSHSASYKLQSTLRRGVEVPKTIRRTLGRTTDYTIEQARVWAEGALASIRRGDWGAECDQEIPSLRQAYDQYVEHRHRRKQCVVHTANIRGNADRHLSDWLNLKVDRITRPMVVERHSRIGHTSGLYSANHTIKQLRAVLNSVDKLDNPVRKITWFQPEPVKDGVLDVAALPEWWHSIDALENPIRSGLHKLALLSGMRYGHLTKVRREWIRLADRRIDFPKLKRGKPFSLPLSEPMVEIVSKVMSYDASPFLFWSTSRSGHIEEWREDNIRTGHCIRRTYISLAATTALPQHHREWLVDHAPSGMHGHYQSQDIVFPRLLEAQQQISQLILGIAWPCDSGL